MIIRSDKFIANPTVTCSIIVYNQRPYIGKCIEGMLEQVCNFPFNIIISDDCSTDGTQEVLKDYQARYPELIKLVLNEQNGGIATNWVNCCKAFEGGEYVAFCDGDDFWSLPQKLQMQYDYMQSHPECSGITTAYDSIDENGDISKTKITEEEQKNISTITQLQIWQDPTPINPGGMLLRKDIFDKVMPLDAFIAYDFPFQDWPALLIMAGYGEIHYLPIATYTYRIGHVSDSHPGDLKKLERRMERGNKMYQYLHNMFPALEYDDNGYENYTNDVLLKFCIKQGNYKMAKQYAQKLPKRQFREICCNNWATFQLYRGLKKARKVLLRKH